MATQSGKLRAVGLWAFRPASWPRQTQRYRILHCVQDDSETENPILSERHPHFSGSSALLERAGQYSAWRLFRRPHRANTVVILPVASAVYKKERQMHCMAARIRL
ncbi:hypothetical protein NMY22_g11807 [Coprinellus aureogranulatus]|nr:hypothetical protein NMY22_g11807 [Coprinellus aureogranulatus]